MEKLNPFFEVDGNTYEIVRTRAIECEFDNIRKRNKLSKEQISLTNDYAKQMIEYQEILENFNKAKNDYFNDILDDSKKAKYLAFKELSDEKYKEMKEFEFENENFSIEDIQDLAYKNGVELLYFALKEEYNLTIEQSKDIWDKYIEHFGINSAKEWINMMVQVLFDTEEEEENPFLKQARAINQRKGLSKRKN